MVLLSLTVLAEPTAAAATWTVASDGTGQFRAIQHALDQAADQDTVLVRPGAYVTFEPLDFNRLHDRDDPQSQVKNLVLRSEAGPEQTVLMREGDDARAIV
jgi:hypothetical protein